MIGIEIKNLSFSYTHQPIFTNLNCSFSAGDKIQITGDNGAGKTTLLKLVATLLKPQEGHIRYFDPKVDVEGKYIRKSLGVSLDDSHLLRNFSVVENLALYQKLYTGKYSFETIAGWLDKFGLQSYRETSIQYLSQGEQKKVSLIKAFLHEPEVLIFDEPTNSLDAASKVILSDLFKQYAKNHLLLVSTHDHEWASTWSNRSVKVSNGQVV